MLESTQYASIKLLGFVESFYNIPRFGNSKDISQYFSDDLELRSNYFQGLIVVFCFLMTAAALWFILLLILRILGARVGCGSGNPAVIPAESMMSKGSYSVHTDETGEFIVMQADQNRVNRTRIVYFISGLYAVFACGFLIYGFAMIMNAFSAFHDYAEDALDNIESDNLDTLLTSAGEFASTRDELVTDLNGFCSGATATVNGLNLATVITSFSGALDAMGDIANDASWASIQTDFTDLEKMMEGMVSFLDVFDGPGSLWFVLAIVFTTLSLLFCMFMIVCAWRSGKEGYQFVGEERPTLGSKFLHYVATPLFALCLAFAWFASSTLLTSHALNSDFCYDEIVTGETALRILVERGYDTTSDAYLLVDEYLHGCLDKTLSPSALFNDYETLLDAAELSATDFQDLAPTGDTTDLAVICGGDTSSVYTKNDELVEKLQTLKTDFATLKLNVSCETMAPIMQKAVYETGCQSLSRGLLWAFISSLLVATFGTLMLTLRSATQRPQIYIVAPNPASRSDLGDDSSFG